MSSDKLSREQIDFVLRRAAELDTRRELQRVAARQGEEVGVDDLVRLGEEAGIGPDSIMRAMVELRRQELEPDGSGTLTRTFGPSRLVVMRDVPGPALPVQRAVEKFMRSQLMTVRRHHGERVEWERAVGLWPGLARSLDFAKRYALAPASRIETVVVAQGPDTTCLSFDIDLTDMRRDRMFRLLLRATAAFGIVGLGGAAWFAGFGLNDVIALFSGGALGGGLFALERRRYQEARERVALAPERFLDLLVQRRKRVIERGLAPSPDE